MAPRYGWLPKVEEEQSLVAGNNDACSVSSAEVAQDDEMTSRKRRRLSLSTCKDVLLIGFATLGFVSLLRPLLGVDVARTHRQTMTTLDRPSTAATPTSCSCGNSTAQARALGCKYDSLAAAWLPEHCRDDELTAEFERSGPGENGQWTYWRDLGRTQEISLAELAEMGDDRSFRFYMTGRWHVVHCIFYWRKEHRARFNGKIVESRSDSEGHIKHCGRVILDPEHETIAGVELNADH